MTPQELAALHRAAFTFERPWSAQEFEELLASPYVSLIDRHAGFALIRTLAQETELLTLAVEPTQQRRGIADALVVNWLEEACADVAFLEVAADNTPARRLYAKHGFAETGQRNAYYARPDQPRVDALLMAKPLTHRNAP